MAREVATHDMAADDTLAPTAGRGRWGRGDSAGVSRERARQRGGRTLPLPLRRRVCVCKCVHGRTRDGDSKRRMWVMV